MILLFGIIDFGRYVYTMNTIGNGAREGARSGSVTIRPTPLCDGLARDACVQAVVKDRTWGVPANILTTTVTCERVAPNDSTPQRDRHVPVPDQRPAARPDAGDLHPRDADHRPVARRNQLITGEALVTVNQ